MDEKIDHRGFVINPGELLQHVAAVFHIVHAFQLNNHVHCIDGADLHHDVKKILHENLVADTAVAIKGRVNWREDKMSVFGLEVIQLDVDSAEHNAAATLPFVLHADAVKLDQDVARELRNTLAAHRGTTPVQLVLCNNGRKTALALSEYPVTVGSSLLGELKAISGITVA